MFLRGLENEKLAILFLTFKIRRNPEKKEYSNIVSLWLPILFMTSLYKLQNLFLQPTDTLNHKIKLSMNIGNIMNLSC